ncbi:MAG: chemotaxis protein CheW [Acidimicrobiales bacterium]
MTKVTSNSNQYCTFYLGDLLLGISVEGVQEVIKTQEMTPVPLAAEVVTGLVNLRGQIVTALDMRKRFELEGDFPKPPMNIVISKEDGAVSLLVDEIGDVVTVDPERFEEPPETLDGACRELVTGVFKLEDQLLLVLDLEAASYIEEFVG